MDQTPVELPKISSVFPNPPPFYQSFTPPNIDAIATLRRTHLAALTTSGAAFPTIHPETNPVPDPLTVRIPNIPNDLHDLQPPPEPADGRWRVFGDPYTLDDKLPTLEEQNIERLVPETDGEGRHLDRAFQLKKLAKSLLLNFLELVDLLGRAPEASWDKITDIRTILINIHHTLNEYRPHQARESVIAMLQDRLDQTRSETANINCKTEAAKQVLEGLGSIEVPKPFRSVFDDAKDEDEEISATHIQRAEDAWTELDDV